MPSLRLYECLIVRFRYLQSTLGHHFFSYYPVVRSQTARAQALQNAWPTYHIIRAQEQAGSLFVPDSVKSYPLTPTIQRKILVSKMVTKSSFQVVQLYLAVFLEVGLQSTRPHFLSTVPGAAVFSVKQAQLLNAFSTSDAASRFTPSNMREEPIPIRQGNFDATALRSQEQSTETTESPGVRLGIDNQGQRQQQYVMVSKPVLKKAHRAVEELMNATDRAKYPRSILEEYDLETIQSAIKMLTGYVLDQGPVSATH